MSGLNDKARAFVEAMRFAEDPTDRDERRVRDALKLRLAGAAVVGTAAALATKAASAATAGAGSTGAAAGAGAGTSVPVSILVKYVGIGTLIGSVAVGGSVMAPRLLRHSSERSGTNQEQPVGAPSPSCREESRSWTNAGESAPAPEAVERPGPAEPTVVQPLSARIERPGSASSAASSAPRSSLDDEIPLIHDAQAAVRAGQWATAERLLDEHARRFPVGVMSEDRAALRVFLLCASGRGSEGRGDAQRFLQSHPHSPYAGQVSSSCGLIPAPGQENR